MKSSLTASVLALCVLMLAGCSNDYMISTNDGRMIESDEKPELDDDTGLIEYEDEDGDIGQLPQSDVREIREK